MGLQKISHVLSLHRHLSLSWKTLISHGQQHPPEALKGQGEEKPTGPVQWAVVLLFQQGFFRSWDICLSMSLECPASELGDHTDAGAAAKPADSRRWPCQTHVGDRMPPHFFPLNSSKIIICHIFAFLPWTGRGFSRTAQMSCCRGNTQEFCLSVWEGCAQWLGCLQGCCDVLSAQRCHSVGGRCVFPVYGSPFQPLPVSVDVFVLLFSVYGSKWLQPCNCLGIYGWKSLILAFRHLLGNSCPQDHGWDECPGGRKPLAEEKGQGRLKQRWSRMTLSECTACPFGIPSLLFHGCRSKILNSPCKRSRNCTHRM